MPANSSPNPQIPPVNARRLLWYLPLTIFLLWVWQDVAVQYTVRTLPYSAFKEHLAKGEVLDCQLESDVIRGRIQEKSSPAQAKLAPGAEKPAAAVAKQRPGPYLFRTIRIQDPELVDELQRAGVAFEGVRPGFLSNFLIAWALPLGLMALMWMGMSRGLGSARQAAMSFGQTAKLVADTDTGVTFADVAGCDEAKQELAEVVGFLKTPSRYQALGARIPKGVLLIGPPGTGKTLLARAVAGEAKVPFFALSGSDFVEMFVGVGAARVRDLFVQAKQHAPCIVFIDELDAIGRQRGVHIGSVNDEREQTLNQMLVEMDGFEANTGVILLSATNRPDVLDRALLRPGRFDRQVLIDAPDREGREAILKVHSKGKPLADDANLAAIAQETAGYSGADLANALNEAALLAARRGATLIAQEDLEEAVEKVLAGPERKSRRLDPEARRRVAYHETGHALVAAFSRHADPVRKITIVPRGRSALGYTLQIPQQEQYLLTKAQLLDQMAGLLGGRAAEELVFDDVSTGAENDLEHATQLARQMVCIYGMTDSIGLLHCGRRPELFLPGGGQEPSGPQDCSEQTAQLVDVEVRKLLDQARETALRLLREHRALLDSIAGSLLSKESLTGEEFAALLKEAKDG